MLYLSGVHHEDFQDLRQPGCRRDTHGRLRLRGEIMTVTRTVIAEGIESGVFRADLPLPPCPWA